jgi:hypothetical protein
LLLQQPRVRNNTSLCKSTLAEPALHSPTGPPRGAAEPDGEAAGAATEGSGNPVEARSTACFRSNLSNLWDPPHSDFPTFLKKINFAILLLKKTVPSIMIKGIFENSPKQNRQISKKKAMK